MVLVPIPLILFHLSAPPSYSDLDPGFETEDDDTLSDSDSDEPDDLYSDDSFEQCDPEVKGIIKAYLASV